MRYIRERERITKNHNNNSFFSSRIRLKLICELKIKNKIREKENPNLIFTVCLT